MKSPLANTSQAGQFCNDIIALFKNEDAAQHTLVFERFQNMRPANSALDANITKCNTLSQERDADNLAILEDLSSEYEYLMAI